MSIGGFANSGESAGIGVLGIGDIGGEDDIGDKEDDVHGEGKNEEEEDDKGESGAEEQVETESFLSLSWQWMVSLTGLDLLLSMLSVLN